MREPERNKARRFPHREGAKLIMDRVLTPEEAAARRDEKAMFTKAKEFRDRKRRERER